MNKYKNVRDSWFWIGSLTKLGVSRMTENAINQSVLLLVAFKDCQFSLDFFQIQKSCMLPILIYPKVGELYRSGANMR